MGLICFQGLRRLTLSSAHVKTSEDFLLPGLRELRLLIRMDGKDLSGFSHLKNLERLQIGGPSSRKVRFRLSSRSNARRPVSPLKSSLVT